MVHPKITARKWNGDDSGSWAIFVSGQTNPVVSGLTKSEVPYYKKQTIDLLKKKKRWI